MNKPNVSIRISGPALIEGRVIDAFALQVIGMRHSFHGYSTGSFEATATSRGRL
jgi:hypothetical protein